MPVKADNTIEILMQHVNGLKLDYSNKKLPPWLQACLRHALVKERDNRYASMADFSESLRSRADKKNGTTGDGAGGSFVYDPVVQAGIAPSQPGEEMLISRGISIGVSVVLMIAFLMILFYSMHF